MFHLGKKLKKKNKKLLLLKLYVKKNKSPILRPSSPTDQETMRKI